MASKAAKSVSLRKRLKHQTKNRNLKDASPRIPVGDTEDRWLTTATATAMANVIVGIEQCSNKEDIECWAEEEMGDDVHSGDARTKVHVVGW